MHLMSQQQNFLRVKLLEEFNQILCEHNPMCLNEASADEYQSEALSILARFSEAGFHLAEKDSIGELASSIVLSVLNFWFTDTAHQHRDKINKCSAALVEAYYNSWIRTSVDEGLV